MTELQREYIKYVREIAYIYGLLQAMLYHLIDFENEGIEEGIMGCIESLYKVDPGQANKFKALIEK